MGCGILVGEQGQDLKPPGLGTARHLACEVVVPPAKLIPGTTGFGVGL